MKQKRGAPNCESEYCVYQHITPCGKSYVGVTRQEPKQRFQNGNGYRHNDYFYKAILKYGWDNIEHKIIARGLTKEEAEHAEIALISKIHSNNKLCGYNITSGGECIGKHSEESKQKMRERLTGRKSSRAGVVVTDETRRRMSESAKIRSSRGKCYMAEANKRKVVCQETGVVFNSITEAAKSVSVSFAAVSNVCRGLRPTAGGYRWKYQEVVKNAV